MTQPQHNQMTFPTIQTGSIKRVFLDVDGVLANWSKACCQKLNLPYPVNHLWEETELDEMAGSRIWKECNGYDFWFNIEPFPWAQDIHDIVSRYTKEWIYLTKPSQDPECYSAKYNWIKKHFGDANERLWICNGSKARICRGEGDLLIDDKIKNLTPWIVDGGSVFHWQEATPDYDSKIVVSSLRRLEDTLWK